MMKINKCLFLISAVLLILVPFLMITPNARGSDREDWNGKIYWAHFGIEKIAQANHDGSNRAFFADTGSNPFGVSVDVKNGFMYWSNLGANIHNYTKGLDGSIQRCQMDNCSGTTITIVDQGNTANPLQLTLDGVNGYIYWSDDNRDMVLRSKYDGSNVETVLIFKNKSKVLPTGCDIDEENGTLYWSERNIGRIGRIKLADIKMPYTPQESDYIVTEGLNAPGEIKIDKGRRKIFISERFDNQISSVSLEGGIPDVIVDTELSEPSGLALDREKGIIFISEFGARDIDSVNMDGSNFKKICDSGGKFATNMFFVPK